MKEKPKREKVRVVRRKAGLIIEPPTPRPIEADHPALHFFKANPITGVPESPEEPVTPAIRAQSTENRVLHDTQKTEITGLPEYRSTAPNAYVQPALPAPDETPIQSAIPTSNFYRKTNDIADRIDRNLTPAESKIFDQLVRLSVGFNREWCQVRVTTLIKRTGYRSDKTVRAALNGLVMKGLIFRRSHHNNPLGDEYQIAPNGGTPVLRYCSTPVKSTAVLESFITGHLNTILKDNQNDDEPPRDPLLPLTDELRRAYIELTGENPKSGEADRFGELAKILIDELRDAAAQTASVTSPAAFLAAHLRRRLGTQSGNAKGQANRKAQDANEAAKSSQVSPTNDANLNAQEIEEHAVMLAELLANGYTLDQATEQFAQGFKADDWEAVKTAALKHTPTASLEATSPKITPAK
ncbi:MAG: helix-turn-helix domain-containing protein [Pyrinomonadaceae bacterium MAG19_C2-C3]|nr:helix-turn-helix domain-containing protein [Pyrinomonadaceae bacterium MAG19_C2-C3]